MNSQLTEPVVLTIDSDPLSLASIRAALDCQGYKVHTAQDVDSALKIARQVSLDLIISELNVAGSCGIELVLLIRKLPNCTDVPVMFASANQAPDVIRRTHDFGAAYHIKKPFDPIVLTELVQRAMWMPHLVHNHLNQVSRPYMPFGIGKSHGPFFPSPLPTTNH